MNILHISDLHFGTRHWDGNDDILLDKLNSYAADLVINTGDSTSDGLESEYKEVEQFLKGITCENIISIIGNHDKRNMRSHGYFKKYIDHSEIISPLSPELVTKKDIYLRKDTTKTNDYFTDLNHIKQITVDGMTVLVICLDSNVLYKDEGFIEEEILKSISLEISQMKYDKAMIMIHHPILAGDPTPLLNPLLLTDFAIEHKIEDVFCGHTHLIDLRKSTDLILKNSITQYMVGSLSSRNLVGDDNNFLFFKDWGTTEMKIHLIKILLEDSHMNFSEEII